MVGGKTQKSQRLPMKSLDLGLDILFGQAVIVDYLIAFAFLLDGCDVRGTHVKVRRHPRLPHLGQKQVAGFGVKP